jgi:hypothetical protein
LYYENFVCRYVVRNPASPKTSGSGKPPFLFCFELVLLAETEFLPNP